MKRTVQMKTGSVPKVPRIELNTLREWLKAASKKDGYETAGYEGERDDLPKLHPRQPRAGKHG